MSQGTAQKGVQPVSDNGGSLTVDGAVTVSGTVALDAPTLAALESITVVDGGGSLTVDGTVNVGNFPAAQPVTDNGGSLTVDGTVALDAASLAALETIQVGSSALPTNAAQETGGNLATIAANTTTNATAARQDTGNATLAAIAAEIGSVTDSPGAFTLMDRLNTIAKRVDALAAANARGTAQLLAALAKPTPPTSAVRATLLHR